MTRSTTRTPHRARTALAGLTLAGALLLSACGTATDTATDAAQTSETMSSEDMTETPDAEMTDGTATTEPEAMAMAPGAYLTLAEYQDQMADRAGTTVVYFFHATWCPTCRATEESVTADGVPDGLTLVKIDFDTETELRQQYGITQQHTFVQVDQDGTELAKWTGSTTGAEIKAETV